MRRTKDPLLTQQLAMVSCCTQTLFGAGKKKACRLGAAATILRASVTMLWTNRLSSRGQETKCEAGREKCVALLLARRLLWERKVPLKG
jgi:hypothetical protein